MKYRREDFRTYTHARQLPQATDSTSAIYQLVSELLREMRQRQPRGVRLLGVSVSHLTDGNAPQQLMLFDQEVDQANSRVDQLADTIAEKLGKDRLYREVVTVGLKLTRS